MMERALCFGFSQRFEDPYFAVFDWDGGGDFEMNSG